MKTVETIIELECSLEVLVKYDFSPAQEQTREAPYMDYIIEITCVMVQGHDISSALNDHTMNFIEKACLKEEGVL
jgi:hypothetical protein